MDILEAIFTRRSVRRFRDRPLAPEQLEKILRAAMAAPSAGNQQSWQFVVIDDQALLDELPGVFPSAAPCKQAALAILVCGDMRLQRWEGNWVLDCAAATQNLLLAAHGLGLGAVWTGVYPQQDRMDGLAKLLGLPEPVKPLSLVAVGHLAKPGAGEKDRFKPERVHRNRDHRLG